MAAGWQPHGRAQHFFRASELAGSVCKRNVKSDSGEAIPLITVQSVRAVRFCNHTRIDIIYEPSSLSEPLSCFLIKAMINVSRR